MSKRQVVNIKSTDDPSMCVFDTTEEEYDVVDHVEVPKDIEVTEAVAKAFARFYEDEGNNAFAACLRIWNDTTQALKMSTILPAHPLVIEEIKNAEANALNSLPTKSQFAKKLWTMIDEAANDNAKVQFMKLYADARGFIEKPVEAANTQNVTVVLPRCIEIPSHGTDLEWEERLALQQKDLMKRAKGRN